VNASNDAATRNPQWEFRRIEVAEEEAKHHFAPDGDQKSKEKEDKPQPKKRRLSIKWVVIAVVLLLAAGYFGSNRVTALLFSISRAILVEAWAPHSSAR
jgi:hypothetical protein